MENVVFYILRSWPWRLAQPRLQWWTHRT